MKGIKLQTLAKIAMGCINSPLTLNLIYENWEKLWQHFFDFSTLIT